MSLMASWSLRAAKSLIGLFPSPVGRVLDRFQAVFMREVEVAAELDLVAVDLGLGLREFPLACIYPEPIARHLSGICLARIGNIHDVIGHLVIADFARA